MSTHHFVRGLLVYERLEGANPSWPVRYYDPAEIQIQGKVIRTERDW